jgi:ABC-type multidrug transport system ATPase subunit
MNIGNNKNANQDCVVKISQLTRKFDQQLALDDVSIEVIKGQIFGIVGENGAGKTTLIKHMLGQYIAQQGSVKMFGKDPVTSPESVLSKIGYLSEEPELPAWMTVKQLLNYTSAFYPTWDETYSKKLVETFALDLKKRVRELSKGQKARVGLVLAQSHKPELLLLDEPSSGLDPNVRRDILSAVIKTVSDEGRTVIFSSHLLEEVERVCDHLMMLDKGRILLFDSMENILTKHRRFVVKDHEGLTAQTWLGFGEVIYARKNQDEWLVDIFADAGNFKKLLADKNMTLLSERSISLNEIFVSRTSSTNGG